MAEKANGRALVGEAGGSIEIVKNVAPSRWHIESCVDDGKIPHLFLQWQLAQPCFVFLRQVVACPLDGALG